VGEKEISIYLEIVIIVIIMYMGFFSSPFFFHALKITRGGRAPPAPRVVTLLEGTIDFVCAFYSEKILIKIFVFSMTHLFVACLSRDKTIAAADTLLTSHSTHLQA
jgi:hypothetical protein